jgi:hypothetical protein
MVLRMVLTPQNTQKERGTSGEIPRPDVERETRLELATACLGSRYSTN